MSRDMRIPFASTASVSLSFTSGGGFSGVKTPFDTSKLINVWRVPIEIRELRVMIESRSADVVVASPVVNLEVKLGKDYITDGPVPVAVLSPYRIADDGVISTDDFQFDNTGVSSRISYRRIIFHRPAILPSGKGFSAVASIPISPFMTTLLFNTNFTAVVHLTMVGRFMAPFDRIPDTNQVPIISHTELSQARRVSFETELRNPLAKSIKVQRLVGSIVRSEANLLVPTFDSRNTGIEFRFPDNEYASELSADFPRVFGQCRVWPATFEMKANSRIRTQINANATEDGDPFFGYQVALIGTREEAI